MKVKPWFKEFGTEVKNDSNENILDLDINKIKELLSTSGTVLFRSYMVNPEDFLNFASKFQSAPCPHVFTSSIRKPISKDGSVIDVFGGNDVVSLHGEMYFLPKQPDLIWFYCITPSKIGGETTVCDGIAFLNALSPSTRELFMKKKIMYMPVIPPSGWQSFTGKQSIGEAQEEIEKMAGVKSTEVVQGEHIRITYEASAIKMTRHQGLPAFVNSILNVTEERYLDLNLVRCQFADGTPLSKELLNEIEQAGAKITKPINWEPHDIVLIDNSRMQHGRNSFEGERKIQTKHSMAA